MTFEEAQEIYGNPNNLSATENLLYLVVKALMTLSGGGEEQGEPSLSLYFGSVIGRDTELKLNAYDGMSEVGDVNLYESNDGVNFSDPILVGTGVLQNDGMIIVYYPTANLVSGYTYYIEAEDQNANIVKSNYVIYN